MNVVAATIMAGSKVRVLVRDPTAKTTLPVRGTASGRSPTLVRAVAEVLGEDAANRSSIRSFPIWIAARPAAITATSRSIRAATWTGGITIRGRA